MPPDGGQPGGYSQYNRGPQGGYGGAPQGGGYSNVPQGGYAPRGQQARPQQYRQAPSQAPAAEDVPQMPIDEPPFETVEGVDDDIPF